jgi:hypothetical protein
MHAAQFAADHAAPVSAAVSERRDLDARLRRLLATEAEVERRAREFRTPLEEREMLMMPRPVSAERAFALFGLLLGTLPPAAIFIRLFGYGFTYERDWGYFTLPAMCLAMNIVCAFVGRRMGRTVGQTMIADSERQSWARMLLSALVAAFVWGAATGAAGGAIFFGIGWIVGVIYALMVALPAFLVFTTLHRLLARGGMIDARHLRPLAWGVAATAAALVLSPSLLTY